MEMPVAETDIRRIVKELKTQRRQLDRAIAALEAVVNGTQRHQGKRAKNRQNQRSLPDESGNGTTGQVVPFARALKLSGS